MEEDGLIQFVSVIVNEKPYCFWDSDLTKTNLEFLNEIDPTYYEYIAKRDLDGLSTESKAHAALSLRSHYYHSLETMFAFICAAIQSPTYSVAWLQLYKNEDLRDLIGKIDKGGSGIKNAFGKKAIDWETVSRFLLPFKFEKEEDDKIYHKRQEAVLDRLASEFLSSDNISEYNSIKHGLRTISGGFTISIGLEDKPGVMAPPEKMQTFIGSNFGTKFFVPNKMSESNKINLKLKNKMINWNPEANSKKILLVGKIIKNVIQFLKLLNGVERSKLVFEVFSMDEGDLKAWDDGIQMLTGSFGIDVSVAEKHLLSKEKIFEKYDADSFKPSEDQKSEGEPV